MINGERIYLRPVQKTDDKDIYEYAIDEDTGPMAGWPPHENIETTQKIIEMWLNPEHTEQVYAIVYKENEKTIGTIGIQKLNNQIKDAKDGYVNDLIKNGVKTYELGCTISKQYWNKGIATDLLKITINYLFENTDAEVVVTAHYEENIGSKRAQEKNNMQVVYAYEREKKWWKTDCTTMIVRAKTKEQWLQEKLEKEI